MTIKYSGGHNPKHALLLQKADILATLQAAPFLHLLVEVSLHFEHDVDVFGKRCQIGVDFILKCLDA